MNIGIVGAGNVGGALGKRWTAAGHNVKFGVRDANKPEVVAIATPWPATRATIESAGDLAGKIVIDCTNPVKPDLSGLAIGHTISTGEQVASWAKGARVVKCFNTTGANNMENPHYGGDRPVMFLCGDATDAKSVVMKLDQDVGFEMIDAGELATACLLEPVSMLWIHLAFRGGLGRDFAFKLLHR